MAAIDEKLVRFMLNQGPVFVRPSAVVALVLLTPSEMTDAGYPHEMGGTAVFLQGGHRLVLPLDMGVPDDVAHKLGLG